MTGMDWTGLDWTEPAFQEIFSSRASMDKYLSPYPWESIKTLIPQ